VALLGAVSAARAQTTWYVDDDDCPGPGSGGPGDPFCYVQDAIDAAANGDTVVVGVVDFLFILADWGACEESCCLSDLDLDGEVGVTDFLLVLANGST
jgi:hypothetical protein